MRSGRVDDIDPVQLAECLDIASMVPEENDLMESQNVTAVLDIVHLDLNARPAPTSRGCIDISDHRASIEIEGVGLEKLYQRHWLSDWPEDLRGDSDARLGMAA